MTSEKPHPSCECKVGRKAAKFGFEDLDQSLRHRREAKNESLRALAAYVNQRIVAAAVDRADGEFAADPVSVYDVLTDDVAPEREVRIRNLLTDNGVDVNGLREDFVSYQAIRSHLQECLGMETSRQGITTVEEGKASISQSRERGRDIIKRTLERLQNAGTVPKRPISVSLSVRVNCEECGSTYTVDEYLDERGCTCPS